jgi:hypothetical protein
VVFRTRYFSGALDRRASFAFALSAHSLARTTIFSRTLGSTHSLASLSIRFACRRQNSASVRCIALPPKDCTSFLDPKSRTSSKIGCGPEAVTALGDRPRCPCSAAGFPAKPCAFSRHPRFPMSRQAAPDLSLPLAEPITLGRGPRSHLVTLMDAAILIRDLEPFRQARPVWDRAAEMMLLWARPGSART